MKKQTLASVAALLKERALAYPETTEDHPWGETAIKVKGKAFIFLRQEGDELSFSMKLPDSRDIALDLPFTEPTHYGLGKHGWVSAKLKKGDDLPVDMFLAWLDESFRAVAPKKLVKAMG